MDCDSVNEYVTSFIFTDGSVDEKLYLDLNNHLESCFNCNKKWKLEQNLIQQISDKYNSIDASDLLLQKINQNIENEVVKSFNKKLNIIAACFVLLIGVGLADKIFLNLPNALEVHRLTDYHLVSNEIDDLLEHIGSPIEKNHFNVFEKADFKPHAASKFEKLYKKASSIALKNTKGQKLTLCFYPKNYKLPHNDIVHVDGMQIFHGSTSTHNFAYWEKSNMTLVLISDSLLPHELVELAGPLID